MSQVALLPSAKCYQIFALALLGSEQMAAVISLSNLGGMTGMAQSDKCPGLQRSQAIQHGLHVLQQLK